MHDENLKLIQTYIPWIRVSHVEQVINTQLYPISSSLHL